MKIHRHKKKKTSFLNPLRRLFLSLMGTFIIIGGCSNLAVIFHPDHGPDSSGSPAGTPLLVADADSDGVEDAEDNCPAFGNSDQKDSDDDGVGDPCDNCRYHANSKQEDVDNDLLGDACDQDIDSVLTLPKKPFTTGEPFWVGTTIVNKSGKAIRTIKPDCYNTYWVFPGAKPLCNRGPAYGIPKDIVTIGPDESFYVTCDISKRFESLPPSRKTPYTLTAIYENYIIDPDDDPKKQNDCTVDEDCYTLWTGTVASTAKEVIVRGTTPVERKTADVSFNPAQWDPTWAKGKSPPISVKISNIEHSDVKDIIIDSILLNGNLSPIIGAQKILNGTLNVQFDRALAVQSLGSLAPGLSVPATVQGEIDGAVFSGTQNIVIAGETGTLNEK